MYINWTRIYVDDITEFAGGAVDHSSFDRGRLSLSTDGATEPRPILGIAFKNGKLILKILYK